MKVRFCGELSCPICADRNLTQSFGKAADCIGCGQCEGVCPQQLLIIDLMKKVSAHFDH